ncbi:MAG TPA: hypothetical protein VGB68_02825 [Pyrinomonadaceae bacterium]|jgi:hypothetical protein
MFKRFINYFKALLPFLFASQLSPYYAPARSAGQFPNGRYMFYGRTNGASRRRKSNRLRISKMTRNKHR